MLKKKSLLVITLLLLVTAVSGIPPAGAETGGDTVKISIEDAVVMAMENNASIRLAELGVRNAEVAESKMDSYLDRLEEMKNTQLAPADYNTRVIEKDGERQLKAAVTLAKDGLEFTKRQVALLVKSSYYDALAKRMNVEITAAGAERAEEQLRLAQLQYEVGSVAKTDVLDAEVSLATAKAEHDKAVRDYELSCLKLKQAIGLEFDSEIELTSGFSLEPLEDVDIEEFEREALETRLDVRQAEEEMLKAKAEFEVAKVFYAPNVFLYQEKEYAYEQKKVALQDVKERALIEIRTAYLNMLSARDGYITLSKAAEQAAESLRLTKLRYKAGMARSIDVAAVENAYRQVELQKAQALYGFNLSKLQFENSKYGSAVPAATTVSMTSGGIK